MSTQPIIEIKGLSKKYASSDTFSLNNINLTIQAGEKFGILGPNAAGKTTLISILCGIIHASGGSFSFFRNNKSLSLSDIKKSIGLVPQEYALYNELTPKQNLEYFAALYHMSKKQIGIKTEQLLSVMGLAPVAEKKVQFFSGGMKRRLNLAIALMHDPEILFLDEPTVGMDAQSRNAIFQFLNELNSKGTTIIYTSHHLSEVQAFCSRVAIIDHGSVVAFDTIDKLLARGNTDSLHELFLQLTGEEYRD